MSGRYSGYSGYNFKRIYIEKALSVTLMPLTAFLPSALMEKLQQAIDFYDYDEALALLPPDTL